MRFLCIGGGGFVGTNFNYFINKHKLGTVVNLDNGSMCTNNVDYFDFDVCEEPVEKLIPFLRNADVVINFAAITRVEESIKDPLLSYKTNVSIQNNICESLRILKNLENRILPLLFISTGGAIAGETKQIINENILPKPISVYGASKLSCESIGYSYFKSFNLDIRNLRFTNIYGPYSEKKESVIARYIKLIMSKKKIEVRDNGNMKRDFIFVEDVCQGIYDMITKGYPGLTVQFGSGESVTLNDIIKIFYELYPKLDIEFTKSLQGEVSSVSCDIHLAKELLNWTPKFSLQSGIYKTWEYFSSK